MGMATVHEILADRQRPPPPVIHHDTAHQGQVWVWLMAPAGWRLGTAGVRELARLARGAALDSPGLTPWSAGPAGGYVLAAEEDADLVELALRDVWEEHGGRGSP
jgi:hypothetical protein